MTGGGSKAATQGKPPKDRSYLRKKALDINCSLEQFIPIMRQARILGKGRSFYHCISRVVDQRFIFGRQEKEFFRKTMRALERFLEVRVVTYSLMSNHFHLLLEVPAAVANDASTERRLTPEELLLKLPLLYDERSVRQVAQELERAAASGSETWEREILERYEARLRNLSVFLKELKQRFTQWYNRRKGRRGTLWEERFKSVLVEGSEDPLLTMAAYIDLNPVRAGLVKDPKDYRWCGYAEAVAGVNVARRGLSRILEAGHEAPDDQHISWRETAVRYRLLLFDHGRHSLGKLAEQRRKKMPPSSGVTDRAAIGVQLSIPEVLRCRVRYFCDGAVLGTRGFVDEVLRANCDRTKRKRKTGARPMQGAAWGDLHVMRDLRKSVIDPSPIVLSQSN